MSKLYWVNINATYNEVVEGEFLWAPISGTRNDGSTFVNGGWKTVPQVKCNDVILCHRNQSIIGFALATGDAYRAPRPQNRSFAEWDELGNKIPIKLHLFPAPVATSSFKSEFIEKYNSDCTPTVFSSKATVNQFYLSRIPAESASLLMSEMDLRYIDFDVKINTDKDTIDVRTSSEAVVKVRKGQEKFRKKVLKFWSNSCALTQLNIKDLLIASHIVPWSLSSSKERLDEFNGLALSPSADKLFDKGFISFNDNGNILIKEDFTTKNLNRLGLDRNMRIKGLSMKHKEYLARHRKLFQFES